MTRPVRHPCTRGTVRGATLVEFTLVALLALLPLALGVLQVALLYTGRYVLDHATFLAARAGAVSHADRGTIERHLAKGLAPLRAGAREDITTGNVLREGTRAYARAYVDVLRPDRMRLRILNPTPASFADFGRVRDGRLEIPLDLGQTFAAVGPRSGQTLADATLLRLRVDYCQPLIVPLVDRATVAILRRFDPDPFHQACYAARAVAIAAHALVQMHSPPRRAGMGSLG
jgi:hypothetical protein